MKPLLAVQATAQTAIQGVDAVRSQVNIALSDLDFMYLETLIVPHMTPPSIAQPQGGLAYLVICMLQANTQDAWDILEKRIAEQNSQPGQGGAVMRPV